MGWTRFSQWTLNDANYNTESGDPRSRMEGASSLRIYNEFLCWLNGVYQQVTIPNFTAPVRVNFSAWGRTWASSGFDFDLPHIDNVNDGFAVGIDPFGGTNPNSTSITWVETSESEDWVKPVVTSVAFTNQVTVFIRLRLGALPPGACNWPYPVMMGFTDDATIWLGP